MTRLAPVTLLCLAGALAGCVSIGRQYDGTPLRLEKLEQVRPGTTTRQEVLALFGAPSLVQRREVESLISGLAGRYQGDDLTLRLDPALFNDVYIYEYRRVNRLGVLTGLFNYVKSDEKSDRVVFFFDRDGKVAGFGVVKGTELL
jgi:hypothetical protein